MSHFATQNQIASGPYLGQPSFSGQIKASASHFGNVNRLALKELGPLTRQAFKAYAPLADNLGLRFILMDIVGWGGLRTLVDLHREKFYLDHVRNGFTQETNTKSPKINVAAACERIQREISATINDVLLAGPLVAIGTALVAHKALPYAANFIDRDLMEKVKDYAGALAKLPEIKNQRGTQALNALYEKISDNLLTRVPSHHHGEFKALLTAESLQKHATARIGILKSLNALIGGTPHQFNALPLSEKMAHLMGQSGNYSIELKNAHSTLRTSLPNLLDNLYKIQARFLKQNIPTGMHWAEHLSGQLNNSLKAHTILPLALFLPVAMNLIMPHVIQSNSVKNFGILSYPGDESHPYPNHDSSQAPNSVTLAYNQAQSNIESPKTQNAWQIYNEQTWQNKYFKFFKSAWDNKNPFPFLGAAAFIPFVLGLYNVGHGFKFSIPKGLKPGQLKEFIVNLSKRHAFDVSAPWASEQQQATSYAATLFSRIVTARTPMEFIERLTESFASYACGFELTPALNAKLAKSLSGNGRLSRVFQKVTGLNSPDLIKADGALRSTQEVLSIKDAATRKASLTAQTWILNWGMTAVNTIVMGVLMPIACIMVATAPRLFKQQTPPIINQVPKNQAPKPQAASQSLATQTMAMSASNHYSAISRSRLPQGIAQMPYRGLYPASAPLSFYPVAAPPITMMPPSAFNASHVNV